MSGISGLNLDNVYGGLQQGVKANEASLKEAMGKDLSKNENLMKMQHEMQKWSLSTSAQSNIVKSVGEAMKSTVQNIR